MIRAPRSRWRRRARGLSVALALTSCGPGATRSEGASSTSAAAPTPAPAEVRGAGARGDPSRPIVVLLHGLGDSGDNLAKALELAPLAERLGFAFASPDGATDGAGRKFWNAGALCCDFDARRPDHAAQIGALFAAPPDRPAYDGVVVAGFSNGGYMAYRLACDDPRVTAIVSLGGGGFIDRDPPCKPARPVAVVHVHGDADRTVPYEGGFVLGDATRPRAPPVSSVVAAWGAANACSGPLAARERLDLDARLPGAETRVEAFSGCGAPVELWTMEGGHHVSPAASRVLAAALERLLAPGGGARPRR